MTWRAGTFLLAVVATALGLWGLSQAQARMAAERELDARYQQAFFEAVEHVENVEVLLSKSLVASTPEQVSRLFAELRAHAQFAQSSLTQLPLVQGTLMTTSKFLAQVGDFAFAMTRRAAAGEPPSGEEIELVRRLREEAATLSAELHGIQREAAEGRMPWEQLRRRADRELDEGGDTLDQPGFTRMAQHFDQIPVIQYDGPFSDHVLQREPAGLTGENVSEAQAEEIAMKFAPVSNKDELVATAVQRVSGGKIPGYRIALRRQGDEDARPQVVMDVSVKGGHVVWMLNSRDVREANLSMEQAHRRAQAFLKERGFENMVATYASEADNLAVIPFVPEVDGVLIYPDLVKVTVAMDTGQVVGFESLGYLMSHKERSIPAPTLSAEEARERIAPGLSVTGEPRLAIIPLETAEEVFTWEIPVRMGVSDLYLVYLNAETGEEERILRLVHTGEGTTAM